VWFGATDETALCTEVHEFRIDPEKFSLNHAYGTPSAAAIIVTNRVRLPSIDALLNGKSSYRIGCLNLQTFSGRAGSESSAYHE
jgi:hypothetical protein